MKTLQDLRSDRGLTQAMVADMASLTGTTISQLELGNHYPSVDTMHKLAAAYAITVPEIVLAARATADELKKLDNQDKSGSHPHGTPADTGLESV